MNPDELKKLMEKYVYSTHILPPKNFADERWLNPPIYPTPTKMIQSNVSATPKSGDLIARMRLIDSVTVINVDTDLGWHKEHMHDNSYKYGIKTDLCKKLSEKCLEKSTFTQIALPDQENVRITAKCVVLSIDEFENVIRKLINVG